MILRVAAVLALAGFVAADVAGGAAQKASIRFVTRKPVVVRAAGFVPRERVRVRLTAGDTGGLRVVRSSRSGTFTVGFGTVPYDPCNDALSVVATGRRDRAVAKIPPRMCLPVRTP